MYFIFPEINGILVYPCVFSFRTFTTLYISTLSDRRWQRQIKRGEWGMHLGVRSEGGSSLLHEGRGIFDSPYPQFGTKGIRKRRGRSGGRV